MKRKRQSGSFSSPNKRRRRRYSDERRRAPTDESSSNNNQPCSSNSVAPAEVAAPAEEAGPALPARRRRPRTTGIRKKLCTILEQEVSCKPRLSRANNFFSSLDDEGTPRANLRYLIRCLNIREKVQGVDKLDDKALLSLNNITEIFEISKEDDGELYILMRPTSEYKDRCIYVDNLPEGCNESKLTRLATKYGNVTHVYIPPKPKRIIKTEKYVEREIAKTKGCGSSGKQHQKILKKVRPKLNAGSRPRSYGFIQFVNVESAEKMYKDYIHNDPSIGYDQDDPAEVKRRRPVMSFTIIKLRRSIRALRARKRRRDTFTFVRLKRLRNRLLAFLRKEMECRRQAYILANGHAPKRRRKWWKKRKAFFRARRLARKEAEREAKKKEAEKAKEVESLTESAMESDIDPRPTNVTKKEEKIVKRKRKKRRHPSRAKNFIPGKSVKRYFEQIQVLPRKRYEELTREYRRLISISKQRCAHRSEDDTDVENPRDPLEALLPIVQPPPRENEVVDDEAAEDE